MFITARIVGWPANANPVPRINDRPALKFTADASPDPDKTNPILKNAAVPLIH